MKLPLAIALVCLALGGCKQLAPYGQATGTSDGGDGAAGDGPPRDGSTRDGALDHDGPVQGDGALDHDGPVQGDGALDHDGPVQGDHGVSDGLASTEGSVVPDGGTIVVDAAPLLPGQVCSLDNWCWENPLPQGNDLRGVWKARDMVYAVGRAGTFLWRFDGSAWAGKTGVIDSDLESVWASPSTDEAWAVGSGGKVLHIKGTSWIEESSTTQADLHAVWGDENGVLHAAGNGGTLLIRQNNGWTPAPRDSSAATTDDLIDLWGVNAGDVVAVGGTQTVLRYDGSQWHALPPPDNGDDPLTAVCSTADGQVFVAEHASSTDGVVDHFTSSGWSTWSMSATISDLWCNSPTEVYGVSLEEGLLHYDGGSWQRDLVGPNRSKGLWLGNDGTRWVVGEDGRIYEGSSSNWIAHRTSLGSTINSPTGSSATDAWALLGSGGLLHRDATGWTVDGHTFPEAATSIWAASPSELFAVGAKGMMQRWNGATWSTPSPLVTTTLKVVWGTDGQSVFAAGTGGALVHYDGSGWTRIDFPPGNDGKGLESLWGTSATNIYIGADQGVLRRYDGTQLEAFRTQPAITETIEAIWGTNATDFFIAAPSGTILHYQGTQWRPEPTVVGFTPAAMQGRGATEIYAVGTRGIIFQRNSSTWSPQNSGTNSSLNGLYVAPDAIFVTGSGGTILSKGN